MDLSIGFVFQKTAALSPNVGKAKWPLLCQLLQQGCLDYVDYALADQLLKEDVQQLESAAALICYISAATRNGHLCVEITHQHFNPPLKELFPSQDKELLVLNVQLQKLIYQGVTDCPAAVLTHYHREKTYFGYPLYRHGTFFYLQRCLVAECEIRREILQLHHTLPKKRVDLVAIEEQLTAFIQQGALLPEQAAALRHAAEHRLTLLTGGPGTGKTYTAGLLVKVLSEQLALQGEELHLLVAAPTGKAAANLQISLRTVWQRQRENIHCESGTIHKFLRRLKFATLAADLILIDESSMIGVDLMLALLRAVKPGARLILLGDRYQLPPVEGGSIFSDLTEWAKMCVQNPLVKLERCLRIESRAIADFAEAVKLGNTKEALALLKHPLLGIRRLEYEQELEGFQKIQTLIKYARRYFPSPLAIENPLELLAKFSMFRILSPMRQGEWGIEQLNRRFLQMMVQQVPLFAKFTIPILVVQNDERLELYNGDMGLLICQKKVQDSVDVLNAVQHGVAIFPLRSTEQLYANIQQNTREIPSVLLPRYEPAYCLSVHKSQGSEFNHVLLLLPEGSEVFGREVLYTAVTRAKRQLDIFAADQILKETIEKKSSRLSGLVAACQSALYLDDKIDEPV